MARLLALSLLLAAALGVAGAQSTTATTNEALNLDARAPQENASAGWVSQRAPGTWVRAAIGRHSEYIAARVNGPRFGEFSDLLMQGISTSGSSSSGSSASGGISGLLDQFGDVTDLINTFAGTGGTTTTGGSGTSLEDLIAIRDYYAALEGEGTTKTEKRIDRSSTTQARNGYTFGGAIARLPKAEERFQDTNTTTDEPKFITRLVTAWTETFFDAISLAFLTPQFREVIADGLRPLLLPDAADGSGNGGSSSGDSIDDIDGTGGGTDGGGSTI